MTSALKVSKNRLLESLSAFDVALLTPYLKTDHFEQGAVLQELGEPIDHVYFPHSGMVSLLAVMRDGAGVETATVGREGAVNIVAGLGGLISAPRAVMQVAGDVGQIPAPRFRAAVELSPTLRGFVARYHDVHLAIIQQTAGCNALHRVSARLCRWLLQTRDRCESDAVPLTQEFLSEMLGVQRTSITAVARELQDEGLIRYRRGRVDILDRAGLERRACECYETVRLRSEALFS